MYYRKEFNNGYTVMEHESEGYTEMDDSQFVQGYMGLFYKKDYIDSDEYNEYVNIHYNYPHEIQQCHLYLAQTDYVVTKLSELKLDDIETYEAEHEKYAEILEKRKESRARIRELEALLK